MTTLVDLFAAGLFFFVIFAVIAGGIKWGMYTLKNSPGPKPPLQLSKELAQEAAYMPYEPVGSLFTRTEQNFLNVLNQVAGSDYGVFGKVRIADVIRVRRGIQGKEFGRAFNQIKGKHFDFVICDPGTSKILVVVELDDSSHQREERRKRDEFVDRATEAAGVPLLRVKAQGVYDPNVIAEMIADKLPSAAMRA